MIDTASSVVAGSAQALGRGVACVAGVALGVCLVVHGYRRSRRPHVDASRRVVGVVVAAAGGILVLAGVLVLRGSGS